MVSSRLPAAARRITRLLALVGALPSVFGCQAKPSPAQSFCEQWVATFCEGNRDCCTSTDDTYADVDTCKSSERTRCTLGTGGAFSSSPPLASFDATEGDRALEELRTAAAAGTCTRPPSLDSYALVIGTLAIGDDCSAVGGDLSRIAACAPGARCLLAASRAGALTGQCVRESASGEACIAETCVPDAYCADLGDPSLGSVGLCTERKLDGDPCETSHECVTGNCVAGVCGSLLGPSVNAWCVSGAGLGAVVPPPVDLGSDLGTDVDAGL